MAGIPCRHWKRRDGMGIVRPTDTVNPSPWGGEIAESIASRSLNEVDKKPTRVGQNPCFLHMPAAISPNIPGQQFP
jgi:hypothetical protein